MTYELWDIAARFFFDRFTSEDEALAFVRTLLDQYGDAYAADLELVVGEGGHQNLSGTALAARSRLVTLPLATKPAR